MKKEKEIWLEPEELKKLLEGGIDWNDIESKFSQGHGPIGPQNTEKAEDPNLNIDEIIRETSLKQSVQAKETDNSQANTEEDIRAILLGEENSPDKISEIPSDPKAIVTKDRQIRLNRGEENFEHPIFTLAATDEEADLTGSLLQAETAIGQEEKESFARRDNEETKVFRNKSLSGLNSGQDKKDLFFDKKMDDLEFEDEEEKPALGGFKLVLLLVVVGILTLGFWYYFLTGK